MLRSLAIVLVLLASQPVLAQQAAIIDAPLAASERLEPCRVERRHIRYDEETRVTERGFVWRLARRWLGHRDDEWARVAPIPLTLAQARALLPTPTEQTTQRGVEIFADLGDGTIHYSFDARGRTMAVTWDPIADSSDYEWRYRYACTESARRPQYEDDRGSSAYFEE